MIGAPFASRGARPFTHLPRLGSGTENDGPDEPPLLPARIHVDGAPIPFTSEREVRRHVDVHAPAELSGEVRAGNTEAGIRYADVGGPMRPSEQELHERADDDGERCAEA